MPNVKILAARYIAVSLGHLEIAPANQGLGFTEQLNLMGRYKLVLSISQGKLGRVAR